MKVSKRDILLLVGLLGILAVVCSVFLVYQPTMEKADALEQENFELQARINDLSSKMANKDSYITETENMNREIDLIFKEFPVDVREEDSILLAISQELISPMMISSISISACEPVVLPDDEEDVSHTYEIDEIEEYEAQEGISDDVTASAADANANGLSNENMPSILMARNVTINYLVSYEGLKRGIKNISVQDNRMSIDNLTVAYDESTGLLTGMTSIDMYCIPGQPDKVYVTPNISSVLLGTDNLFGSIELYSERGLEDIEGNEGGDDEADEDTEED
ncbi:MAG: hypothetical protein K2J99_16880 [Lachnospiraceae bacterium]|nr:hypothetical protein [Lachnospiraceae bacterium]